MVSGEECPRMSSEGHMDPRPRAQQRASVCSALACVAVATLKLAGLVVNATMVVIGVCLWWFLLECYNSRVGTQMQAACEDIALGPAMKGTRWRYSEFTEGCGQHKRFFKFVAVAG